MKEFYEIFAFFNQVPERGQNGFNPQMKILPPLAKSEVAELDREIAEKRAAWTPSPSEVAEWRASLQSASWEDGHAITAIRVPEDAPEHITLIATPPDSDAVKGQFVRISREGKGISLQIAELEVMAAGQNIARSGKATQSTTGHGGLPRYAIDGNRSGNYSDRTISHTSKQNDPWLEVDLGGEHIVESIGLWGRLDCCPERLDNFTIEVLDADRKPVWTKTGNQAPETAAGRIVKTGGPTSHLFVRKEGLPADVRVPETPLHKKSGFTIDSETKRLATSADRTWTQLATLPSDILKQLDNQAADLTAACKRWSPKGQRLHAEIIGLEKRRDTLKAQNSVDVMVMQDMPTPRPTYILGRGQYNERGEVVGAGVPAVLPELAPEAPRNRLGFAKWLVEPEHPLTARVTVNRVWQRIFGIGLLIPDRHWL